MSAPELDTSAASAAPAVDESTISPARANPERRNSLEKRLAARPDVQDLKNRHILLATTAAPYVALVLPSPPRFLLANKTCNEL
jgi:hypothetical protein